MDFTSPKLAARDETWLGSSPLTFNLLVALLVLTLVCAVSTAALLILRRRRIAAQRSELPLYNNGCLVANRPKHRRTPSSRNIPTGAHTQSNTNFDFSEKRALSTADSMPPSYPLPEIRIHFSEETDSAAGKSQPQRVVVVRMGDNGMGLEPVEEQLPSYPQSSSDRFQSLDIERLGGLKEKDQPLN